MYDYCIVGAGLFGSVFAYEASKKGKKCLVIEKRDHPGGNIFTEHIEGITVHKYGAHIFHTDNKEVWDYMRGFCEFNNFINSPVANYKGELYNLPFNMNTFNKLWGIVTPAEAQKKIEEQKEKYNNRMPKNLEDQALALVGEDIYCKLIKGYTEKQWGRKACELPSYIIKRLPLRFTYDNNYFNHIYQGIPVKGYDYIINKMLNEVTVELKTDFFNNRDKYTKIAKKLVYTGMLDEFYSYRYGELEYRSLRFETEMLKVRNYQGVAVMNYTDYETPYTRIIEHKHFEFGTQDKTVITREYPLNWSRGEEPFYPINDKKNEEIFKKYKLLANKESNVIFGGRLADYKYYDMWEVVGKALEITKDMRI